MKTCSSCKVDKSESEFRGRKDRGGALSASCKICQNEYSKRWFKENKEKRLLFHQNWKSKNIERVRDYSRNDNLKRNYGITSEIYDAMLSRQGGVCEICKRVNPSPRRLAVDHNHKTGHVRALVCDQCNWLIAYIENNTSEKIEKVKMYLERYESSSML